MLIVLLCFTDRQVGLHQLVYQSSLQFKYNYLVVSLGFQDEGGSRNKLLFLAQLKDPHQKQVGLGSVVPREKEAVYDHQANLLVNHCVSNLMGEQQGNELLMYLVVP